MFDERNIHIKVPRITPAFLHIALTRKHLTCQTISTDYTVTMLLNPDGGKYAWLCSQWGIPSFAKYMIVLYKKLVLET